jgi:hypothetical protein
MAIDRETAQSLKDGDELRRMAESDGWKLAKAMLMQRIALLDSVSSLPNDLSFEEIGKQAMFRSHAISLVTSWLHEIEGRIEQSNQQTEVALDLRDAEIVRDYKQ